LPLPSAAPVEDSFAGDENGDAIFLAEATPLPLGVSVCADLGAPHLHWPKAAAVYNEKWRQCDEHMMSMKRENTYNRQIEEIIVSMVKTISGLKCEVRLNLAYAYMIIHNLM